jgi:hypothetical protein
MPGCILLDLLAYLDRQERVVGEDAIYAELEHAL